MRKRLFVGVCLAGLAMGGSAYAQDEFDSITEPEPEPAPEPPPPPPTEPEAVETRAEASDDTGGGTDHDLTVGHWGAQLVTNIGLGGGPGFAPPTIPMLGVRKWTSRDSGWEAGAALAFVSDGGDPAQTTMWVGGTFGFLKALGVMDHMVVFWEPQASLIVIVPNDGVDGTDDESALMLDGRISLGSEIRLGMIGLPHLGVTTRLSAGLQVISFGNTSFFIGTDPTGGEANSVDGLLEANVGFVMYW